MKPSEELALDTIIAVLKEAPRYTMGTTELIKTVKAIIGEVDKGNGRKGKLSNTTILKSLCMPGMIKTCKKVGSRMLITTWEIRRKRYSM